MDRKLGTNERVIWLTSQAGSLNFVIIAHLSSALDESILQKALVLLSQRHPLLRTRIEVVNGQPSFASENVPPIPLRVEARSSHDHWHSEAEKEINDSFPCFTGPLVRVVLLASENESEVLITLHHVIGDAMSGVYIARDLLRIAGQLSAGYSPDVQSLPERPPVEELLPDSARGVDGLVKTVTLVGKQLRNIIATHPKKLPTNQNAPKGDQHAHIIHHTFSPQKTEALITRCHQESTTVHGALCAALLKATAHQILNSLSQTRPIIIGLMSATDLRRFLNPPIEEEVGFFVSLVITAHRIGTDTAFWDLARQAKKAVHRSIKNGEQFVFISLLDKLFSTASPDTLTKRASELYPAAFLMTNLGRLNINKEYGVLGLQKIHFALANTAVPEHLNVAVVTYGDQLVINFSHTEPTLPQEQIAVLADDAIRIIGAALT